MAAEFIASYCADWARAEPRFWTIPPSTHVEELAINTAAAMTFAVAARIYGGKSATTIITRTKTETVLGVLLLCMFPLNAVNKFVLQSMTAGRVLLELCLLPCHVFTALAALCALSTSSRTRTTAYNLLLYDSWMPLLAMAFPDLTSARALASPLLRNSSIALFWLHHGLLFVTPFLLHWMAKQPKARFTPPRPAGAGLLQYLAFVYAFIGVLLCAAALATGRNLNYSLWPPTLPASVLARLGGARYRATIGLFLAFVCGPLMRHVVISGVAALLGLALPHGRAKAKAG